MAEDGGSAAPPFHVAKRACGGADRLLCVERLAGSVDLFVALPARGEQRWLRGTFTPKHRPGVSKLGDEAFLDAAAGLLWDREKGGTLTLERAREGTGPEAKAEAWTARIVKGTEKGKLKFTDAVELLPLGDSETRALGLRLADVACACQGELRQRTAQAEVLEQKIAAAEALLRDAARAQSAVIESNVESFVRIINDQREAESVQYSTEEEPEEEAEEEEEEEEEELRPVSPAPALAAAAESGGASADGDEEVALLAPSMAPALKEEAPGSPIPSQGDTQPVRRAPSLSQSSASDFLSVAGRSEMTQRDFESNLEAVVEDDGDCKLRPAKRVKSEEIGAREPQSTATHALASVPRKGMPGPRAWSLGGTQVAGGDSEEEEDYVPNLFPCR